MKKLSVFIIILFAVVSSPIFGQNPKGPKNEKNPKKRDSLHDADQQVRGDSGKWSEKHRLLLAGKRLPKTSVDAWAELSMKKKTRPTAKDDIWLIFRSKQLDDNDRIWIERIKKDGNQITIVANLAKWKGNYFRNFTYYKLIGVNLGKLEPGKYEAKWVLKPMVFRKFDGDGRPRGNWPKDERAVSMKPLELRLLFAVGK